MNIVKNIIIAAMILCNSACTTIHEYPDHNPVDPTLVNVEINLNLTTSLFEPFVSTRATTIPPRDGYDIRYITEVYASGNTSNEFITRTISSVSNESLDKLTVNFTLQARNYIFLFWVDYVKIGSKDDLHYDTQGSLQAVKIKRPYSGSTDIKDAFVGTKQIDLRPYSNQWRAIINESVDLIRPFAKFEIITTDVEKYVEAKSQSASEPIVISKVVLTYLPRVSVQYNVARLKPEFYSDNEIFTAGVEYLSNQECCLAFDYVFLNGDISNVRVKMDIYDQNNKLLNTVEEVSIQLKRNALTIYRNSLLTREFGGGGGTGIDDSFEGDEIIIPIP